MNWKIRNFKKLSARQIKTYATVLLLSTLSLEVIASDVNKEVNTNPGMEATFENSFTEEIALENWMTVPFNSTMGEATNMETLIPGLAEEVFETEIALESWMVVPFEVGFTEELPVEDIPCIPAP